MKKTLGIYTFPRPIGQLELVALAMHIMRKTNARFDYSVISSSTIQIGPSGADQQNKVGGPLRGFVTFETGERIDLQGIHSSGSEPQIDGFYSSYYSSNIKGMRKSLLDALESIGTAIETYFSK